MSIGGYAGLSVAIKLIEQSCSVTLFDRAELTGLSSASAASSGLLHPMTPKGKEIWKGCEGFSATMSMIRLLEDRFPDKKIIRSHGSCIYRPLLNEEDDWIDSLSSDSKVSDIVTYLPLLIVHIMLSAVRF
jgi:glycine/D-amino acid oxidase-like deaminating enzyme